MGRHAPRNGFVLRLSRGDPLTDTSLSAPVQDPGSVAVPNPPAFQPVPDRGPRWVFIGRNGLRAGWGMLIFIAAFIGLGVGLSALVRFLWHPKTTGGAGFSPSSGMLFEGLQFVVVLAATWILSLIERKPLLFYGYRGQARGVRFVSGLFWGFAAISTLIFTLDKLGYLAIDGRGLNGSAMLRYGALWGIVFLLVGFCEESTLRGYMQFAFARGVGFWWGALILSFIFGFGHHSNPGESPVGLFSAGAVGLVFCLSLWYTGSLWWAVGFHAAWDWGQSFFYGTADSGLIARGHLLNEHAVGKILWSGGTTGPEGSILVIPLLLLMALAMFLWWGPRAKSPFAGGGWRPMRVRQPQPGAEPGTAGSQS
jgi:uncharacterized protein